ncbi:hypothetical protein NQ317_003056 [Molorchus minor]|uniref:ATP-dependent RNA helicase n=1 Tax=Molorchus minor TaxID=1323400 RepID=A0ABQ9JKR4_9CUCU|nr:hypothetical protein NQ317_003056 [Molorchus minor]
MTNGKQNPLAMVQFPLQSVGVQWIKQKIKKEQNESLNVDYVELQAWNVFGLPKSIMCGLQDLKFHEPTQIQSLTLPAAILGKRDILGSSETGSGKTLAFGLPILAGIIEFKNQCTYLDDADMLSADTGSNHTESIASKENSKIKPLYALILTPTRELAIQIKNHLDAVAKYTGINIATIVGGMAAVKQERLLQKGPEIVVATPGRLWELIQQGNSHLSQVDNIKYLAIDETDRMLEKGHFHELHNLLEKINLNKGHKRQNFVFSATLVRASSGNKSRMKFKDMNSTQKMQKIINILGITNPKLVDITSGAGTSSTLTECRISCDMPEKDYYLYYFLKKHPGKTLVFCNSIGCVKRLCNLLNLLECHPLPLHASMPQRQRLKNLERFRDFSNSILIATDVAARGLDIPCVEHVLHYQTPRTSENYIHRSGRTARASEEGITVLFMEPNEVKNYLKICSALEKSKDLPIFPVHENYLKAVKERVNLAREIDKLQLHIRKTNSEVGWIQKMAKNMDIIVAEYPFVFVH